jgi:hypothetical protein
MKMRDHEHGVTLTTERGLEIHIMLIGESPDGTEFMSVSTPHRRVDLRISPKGHTIRHWLVKSPMLPKATP